MLEQAVRFELRVAIGKTKINSDLLSSGSGYDRGLYQSIGETRIGLLGKDLYGEQ